MLATSGTSDQHTMSALEQVLWVGKAGEILCVGERKRERERVASRNACSKPAETVDALIATH